MDHQTRVYESIFEMMPGEDNPTPMVRLHRLNPWGDFPLYAKLEWMNPFGSVKDRAAWALLTDLEERNELGDGRGLVEPTSGNTGISLAGMARARGHRLLAIVPNKVPYEKKVLLKIAGADLDIVSDELCPAPGLGDGSINLAKTYAKAQGHKYVMPNQYENEKNVEAHVKTTGPEIWKQTNGRITHLFTSLGTCGTVTGVSRYLRSKNPKIKVVAVQPTEGHDVPGLRNVSQLSVSKLFDPELVDEILEIDFNLAYTRALELCQNEGLMAGPSSGLILEGALRVVARDQHGFGVLIFPDNIFKYTSNMIKHIPGLGTLTLEGDIAMTQYAHPEILVDTDWVKQNLGKPEIKFVEVDVDTKAYDAGHIPGAVGFNWQSQLQDQVRRDVIGKREFEQLLSAAGISPSDTVVLYGDNSNWFASYAFWLFKMYGHKDVRLMNGGRIKWLNESDKQLTADRTDVTPTQYRASEPDLSLRALLPEVLKVQSEKKHNLVDVRSPDEFSGKVIAPPGMTETAQRGGHIPGAKSIPWSTAANSDGTFKSADDLRKIYVEEKGVDPEKDTIAYCRIGERSSHTWVVLKYLLGFSQVKNYDGSWTEYGSVIGAPIEK